MLQEDADGEIATGKVSTAHDLAGSITLAGVLFAAGIVFIKNGRWPRRSGFWLHCSRCDYALKGIESPKCPECGTDLSLIPPARGSRKRRPVAVAAGTILMLLGVAVGLLADYSRRSSVAEYLPTWLLIRQLRLPGGQQSACRELDRRLVNGSLSKDNCHTIADVALAVLRNNTPGQFAQGMVDWLGEAVIANRVTSEQRNAFFDLIYGYRLQVRPKILLGTTGVYSFGPVRSNVMLSGRMNSRFYEAARINSITVDAGRLKDAPFGTGEGELEAGFMATCPLAGEVPGKHVLKLSLTINVRPRSQPELDLSSPPLWRKDLALEAPFEVVSHATEDSIVEVFGNSIDAAVRKAITVDRIDESRSGMQLLMTISPRPVDVAFQAFARVQGEERSLGSIALPAGQGTTFGFGIGRPAPSSRVVDIVLRSDSETARQTIGINRFWKGEIMLKNIKVNPPPK